MCCSAHQPLWCPLSLTVFVFVIMLKAAFTRTTGKYCRKPGLKNQFLLVMTANVTRKHYLNQINVTQFLSSSFQKFLNCWSRSNAHDRGFYSHHTVAHKTGQWFQSKLTNSLLTSEDNCTRTITDTLKLQDKSVESKH